MDSTNESKNGLFNPSFKFERKTKAFNKYIGVFVALISMFTTGLGVGAFYAFMSSSLDLVGDHLGIYIFTPAIVFIILAYQFYQFIQSLLHSYKFKDNKIIKGKIQEVDKVKGTDLAIDAAATATMIANIGNQTAFMAASAVSNLNTIRSLINLNSNHEFVEKYFDTELYKHREYINPKLVKETKYSLIYTCDNKKKLVVPKIYEGICDVGNKKESSFISRIIKKAAVVFILALAIAIIDLSIANNRNYDYISNISASKNSIEDRLENYGYSLKKNNESLYSFRKKVGNGDRTSEIKYKFDKKGNIKDVDIQLYYNSSSKNVENELRAIISTLNDDFDSEEVDYFIDLVEQNLTGSYKYGKISSNKYSLKISRSGGYVDIH